MPQTIGCRWAAGVGKAEQTDFRFFDLLITLATYPYVYLLTASGLRSVDPTGEEAARSLGAGRARVFARVTLPALRPSIAAASLLVALYVLSDFGVVSLMGYSTLTTGIYVRYESLLALESAAILALVLIALALLIVLAASRFRMRGAIYRSTPGAGRSATIVRLGHLALARTRILLRGGRPVPRASPLRPRVVDRQRGPDLRPGGRGLVGRARLGVDGDGHRDRRRARRASGRAPRLALSLRALSLARTPHVPAERTSGDRRGTRARVRGCAHRLARLPEPRAAPRRVRHSLHAVRARLDSRLTRRGQPAPRGSGAIARPAGRSARRWPSCCRSRDRESSPAQHSSS